ncbi:MAG: RNA polymerase subunit sigma-70 [Lachnospiraceae bacterium]|nr:RNA polymerase subunit sigma-70 [Lachnospiraceae bacterium]
MTEYQRDQIVAMRKEGIGYHSIGVALGLTRDTVRNFCKGHQLAGYGKKIKMHLQEGKTCMYCGKLIQQPETGRKRKFCSEKCRRAWWKGHQECIKRGEGALYIFKCECCGKDFVAYGNAKRKYCSHECYIKARFWT